MLLPGNRALPKAVICCQLVFDEKEIGDVDTQAAFAEWTETFGSERLTGALLNRLTHRVSILEMNGASYRLAQGRARKADKPNQ